MKAKYYDPIFYISSDKMPFNVRIRTILKEDAKKEELSEAINTAIKRFPYFSVRVTECDGEYLTQFNPLPVVVYEYTGKPYALGSAFLNYHMTAVSYRGREVNFYISHVLADGAGIIPFLKSFLYYYFCYVTKEELDPSGIELCDGEMYPDEVSNPYPEEKMKDAVPFYSVDKGDYFRLTDGGYVTDDESTVYYLKINSADFMRFNRKNDGSPCALGAVLGERAIRRTNETEKQIVCDVSFNHRPALGLTHNYRMLCDSFPLIYRAQLKDKDIGSMCTYSRGMVMLHSQPENVLCISERKRRAFSELEKIPTLEEKKRVVGENALLRSVDNTFSISYVGKTEYGAIEKYIDSMYNMTDGSTYRTFFIEMNSFGEWFDVAFIQGFSSDVYYKAFVELLKENDIGFEECGHESLGVPKSELP